MSKDDIIRMAREAGFASADFWPDDFQGLFGCVERFAALVAAAEREACAMQAWALVLGLADQDIADIVLRAIRARGNT